MFHGTLDGLPPVLRLLPSADPVMCRKADLEVKDEVLGGMAEHLSQVLEAPVAVQEPAKESRLTVSFRQRPIRLLLHWVERHTGLQWSLREGSYILAAPVPVADLLQDRERLLADLAKGLPPKAPTGETASAGSAATPEDRAALQRGAIAFAQLSPDLQEAIRGQLLSLVHFRIDTMRQRWREIDRLDEAIIRCSGKGEERSLSIFWPGEGPGIRPGRGIGWAE